MVGGNPVEVQVSVKTTAGDVEGVAMAMGVVSCGEAVESATCHLVASSHCLFPDLISMREGGAGERAYWHVQNLNATP